MIDILISALSSGLASVLDYLSAHVLTCLVPAFFIAGAIAAFVKKEAVLKYFSPDTPKPVSYGIASVSGTILAVCSCTILPIFAGILKKGSGIGPAMTFLFAGPAINILAIIYTAWVLGFDLGVARAVSAVTLAIVIGLALTVVVAAFVSMGVRAVLGHAPDDVKKGEVPAMAIVPEVILAVVILWFGIAMPQPLLTGVDNATSIVLQQNVDPLETGSLLSGIAVSAQK